MYQKIRTEAFRSLQVICRFCSQAQIVFILEIDNLKVLYELANSDPVTVLCGSIVDVENPERLESHWIHRLKPNIDNSILKSSTSFG